MNQPVACPHCPEAIDVFRSHDGREVGFAHRGVVCPAFAGWTAEFFEEFIDRCVNEKEILCPPTT